MKRKKLGLVLGIIILTAAIGCGEAKEERRAPEKQVLAKVFVSQEANTNANIKGRVNFDGEQPKLKKLDFAADPVCHRNNSGVEVHSETVLVNLNKTLKNVFVYIKHDFEGRTFEEPPTDAVLNQEGCVYNPHVMGIRTGQEIEILNSDDTLHNVHALAKVNPEFNYGMPFKDMTLPAKFNKREVMIKVKCDVHPWMVSYIGVMDHPFFEVTGDFGSFDFKGVPPGRYEIEAWHEYYGTQSKSITLPGDEEVIFTFSSKQEA